MLSHDLECETLWEYQTEGEGLGLNKVQYYHSSSKKDQRTLVTQSIREAEEEKRKCKMVQLAKQGASTRWEVPPKELSHKDILETSEASLKFLVKSVYDLLPTPSNKNVWFGTEEKCALCGQNATLNHILAGCNVALTQKRYQWRHDQVLKEIAKVVGEKLVTNQPMIHNQRKKINFVKEGIKGSTSKTYPTSYFDSANDWKLQVDIEKHVKIPAAIMQTNQRPDIVVSSDKEKLLGLIELTVPLEERIEVSGELKRDRYKEIVEAGEKKGWEIKL